MARFKVHPLGEGKHNNIHFVAKKESEGKKSTLIFKIVGFMDTTDAYIVSHSSKIDIDILDLNLVHKKLSEGLMKWDYVLKTPVNEVFKRHENTNAVITHFNLK